MKIAVTNLDTGEWFLLADPWTAEVDAAGRVNLRAGDNTIPAVACFPQATITPVHVVKLPEVSV